VDWAIQPLGIVAVLLLVTLVALARRGAGNVPAGLAALSATLVLWLAASPVPANALLARLEIESSGAPECRRMLALADPSATPLPMAIPGGGMDAWRDSDNAYELLHEDSLRRVERAVDLARPGTRFHVLGGGDNGHSLADLMAVLLHDRGVSDARIVREPTSRSTRENARALAALLPPAAHPTIHLVTSELHLARATRAFERVGYAVCGTRIGSIAAPSVGLVDWLPWLPWLSALERGTFAWRELLATIATRYRRDRAVRPRA